MQFSTLSKIHKVTISTIIFGIFIILPWFFNYFKYLVLLGYIPLVIAIVGLIIITFMKKPVLLAPNSPRCILMRIIIAQIIFLLAVFISSLLILPALFPNLSTADYAHFYLNASIASYLYGAFHPWGVCLILLLLISFFPQLKKNKISQLLKQTLNVRFSASLSTAIDLQSYISVFIALFVLLSFYFSYVAHAIKTIFQGNLAVNFVDGLFLIILFRFLVYHWLLRLTKHHKHLGGVIGYALFFGILALCLGQEFKSILQPLFHWHSMPAALTPMGQVFKYWLIMYWILNLFFMVLLFMYLQQFAKYQTRRVFLWQCSIVPGLVFIVVYLVIFGVKLGDTILIVPQIENLTVLMTLMFTMPYYHLIVNVGCFVLMSVWFFSSSLNYYFYRFSPNIDEKKVRRVRHLFVRLLATVLPCFFILVVSNQWTILLTVLMAVSILVIFVYFLSPFVSLLYSIFRRLNTMLQAYSLRARS